MIRLSKRQVGEADRVGGIELMILWPATLGPEPEIELDYEREATPAEKAEAERLVGESCREHGLVPVHVRVTRLRRPFSIEIAPREERAHLAVTIIGHRWVHTPTRSRGRIAYANNPPAAS